MSRYEHITVKLKNTFRNPSNNTVGSEYASFDQIDEAVNDVLKNINKGNGRIISVTPINAGTFDHVHDTAWEGYGYGYGWGISYTFALLFIIEYPN